jgi:hypothetical protein
MTNKVTWNSNYSDVSGNDLNVPLIGVMCEGCPRDGVPDMATQSAQFEPVAWWWTRNRIGQDLRKLYEVPKLPPKLLTLVSKLDAIEGNYLSRYAPPAEPRNVGPGDDWSVCT